VCEEGLSDIYALQKSGGDEKKSWLCFMKFCHQYSAHPAQRPISPSAHRTPNP